MNKKYKQLEKLYKNNLRCAEFFGLEYTEDMQWWYERVWKPWKFQYKDEEWKLLTGKKILQYTEDLVIPPAWKNTFISPNPHSHILAQWEDNKGRKQYLYHEKWTQARRLINSYTLILFWEVLWDIRTAYKKLLKSDKNSYEFCLWSALLLLNKTVIRVGNRHYFDENGTIWISTLRCEDVVLKSNRLYLEFPWKSWKSHSIHITDIKLKSALIDLCSGDKKFKKTKESQPKWIWLSLLFKTTLWWESIIFLTAFKKYFHLKVFFKVLRLILCYKDFSASKHLFRVFEWVQWGNPQSPYHLFLL